MNKVPMILSGVVLSAMMAFGQTTQQTKETKVGVSLKGIEVTRKRTNTTRMPQRPRRFNTTGNIRVIVDGRTVRFADQGPIMEGGRVLVPLRGVFEQMGATVNWNRERNTVVANRGERRIVLPLDGNTARVDGQEVSLDQPAMVVNGRALVPLRFLGESLGATVDWRATDTTVTIHARP